MLTALSKLFVSPSSAPPPRISDPASIPTPERQCGPKLLQESVTLARTSSPERQADQRLVRQSVTLASTSSPERQADPRLVQQSVTLASTSSPERQYAPKTRTTISHTRQYLFPGEAIRAQDSYNNLSHSPVPLPRRGMRTQHSYNNQSHSPVPACRVTLFFFLVTAVWKPLLTDRIFHSVGMRGLDKNRSKHGRLVH